MCSKNCRDEELSEATVMQESAAQNSCDATTGLVTRTETYQTGCANLADIGSDTMQPITVNQ